MNAPFSTFGLQVLIFSFEVSEYLVSLCQGGLVERSHHDFMDISFFIVCS
uniref:Uncharacterized protein n=1 Tax=Rhizophora mucronata TaxID=61149 RepID=A0A2P2P8Y6_RHIMU